MAKLPYAVILKREPDGRYVARVPKLPEAEADGDSPETAFLNAGPAIERAVAARRERGETIPPRDFGD